MSGMRFAVEPVKTRKDGMVDFHVEAFEGNGFDNNRLASFYVQAVDPSEGWLAVLQKITEEAPDLCQDFAVTHQRWEKTGTPHTRRISEWIEHCPHHIGIGFPAYHVGYGPKPENERTFECTYCGCVFPQSRGIEVDRR